VLMDGLRINPGTLGTAATQNIAPEFVERVEIVKGPRSTLYGSDAIGGVINIITRGAGDGGSVQAGFGSFDTSSASFSAGSATTTTAGRLPARGSTARVSRPESATPRIAAPRTPPSRGPRMPVSERSSLACGVGTPPVPLNTRNLRWRPLIRISRTWRSP